MVPLGGGSSLELIDPNSKPLAANGPTADETQKRSGPTLRLPPCSIFGFEL